MCLILTRNGAKGFERWPRFKYYTVQKLESKFTLEFNAPKITDYIRKRFK